MGAFLLRLISLAWNSLFHTLALTLLLFTDYRKGLSEIFSWIFIFYTYQYDLRKQIVVNLYNFREEFHIIYKPILLEVGNDFKWIFIARFFESFWWWTFSAANYDSCWFVSGWFDMWILIGLTYVQIDQEEEVARLYEEGEIYDPDSALITSSDMLKCLKWFHICRALYLIGISFNLVFFNPNKLGLLNTMWHLDSVDYTICKQAIIQDLNYAWGWWFWQKYIWDLGLSYYNIIYWDYLVAVFGELDFLNVIYYYDS